MITLDHLEPSTTSTQVDPEVIVGSHDTQYARKQLRLVNNLRDIELDLDIDLPIIAVIGSQSSGKSSLIQGISGVPLLKAPGDACTRCPIECRLTRGNETWSCRVFLRRVTASGGSSPQGPSKEPFGDIIVDKDLLEDRILRAQLAILNPSTPSHSFLEDGADLTAPTELSFSPNIVCLEITGPEYSDISFVDLPGLIRNVGSRPGSGYISKDNCIILMTITCETDFANQGAYDLARTHDPHGTRTVGVLTKPDRSPETAHEKWARYICGDMEQLYHGWFCVKQPDTQSPHPRVTMVEAREQEDLWFKKTAVWRGVPARFQTRLGTKKLVQHLEDILSTLISDRILDVNAQLRDLLENTTKELERLGKPPSNDGVGEINSLIDQLVRDIEGGTERRSREDGNLLYLIEDDAVRFKNELRATCPEFRAWSKDCKEPPSAAPLPELLFEDGVPPAVPGTRKIIFLDDVLEKKTRSSVRGLPDSGQNNVAEEYLRSFTSYWDLPTHQFVKRATVSLRVFIQRTIDARCGHFSYGGCQRTSGMATDTIESHLDECISRTQAAMTLLLKLERSGHTRNDRYFRDYKDKFLSHLKTQRELAANNTVYRDLSRLSPQSEIKPHPSFTSAISSAKTTLGKVGFPVIDDLAFSKLLPPHPTDSALEDMARASAGFEVALHRFVDYAPLVVDIELVRGVCQGLATVLRQSFKFSEPNVAERCREFLQEPLEIRREREQLSQKLRRLELAVEELRDFWGP
ncbi:P-loop containing nucleoside triphosphate hydrolase protein [Multifurca ochricompacta]|uniref:P-loop containing nucleoside triphosphate hydrolase protein n=1 Tax=Multifurca ochricompacta TaxID=376703 RepID=A0AAD4M559_9AGAM|nr:P-loop containing nucleoside triphosphate hydrolase protein [Multifurca ochricompacta]